MDATERFWSKVNKHGPKRKRMPTRCWVYTGFIRDNGYGHFWFQGRNQLVHRMAWFLHYGRWPATNLTIDHLCNRRHCVRPSHLSERTRGANALRGTGPAALNKRKKRCVKGHPFSGANLSYNSRGDRVCKECARNRTARYAAKKSIR